MYLRNRRGFGSSELSVPLKTLQSNWCFLLYPVVTGYKSLAGFACESDHRALWEPFTRFRNKTMDVQQGLLEELSTLLASLTAVLSLLVLLHWPGSILGCISEWKVNIHYGVRAISNYTFGSYFVEAISLSVPLYIGIYMYVYIHTCVYLYDYIYIYICIYVKMTLQSCISINKYIPE